MNRKDFEKLRPGDIVVANRKMGSNEGLECKVKRIFDDNRCWISPLSDGKPTERDWWHKNSIVEVYYTSINFK